MPVVNDDGYFENELEATVQVLPDPLRRIYVMSKGEGEGDGESVVRPEPYGLNPPEGAQKVMGAIGTVIKKAATDLATLPQRAIENSQESLNTGNYDPSVPVEAALNTLTFGLPAAKVGAVGSAGGKLTNYKAEFEQIPWPYTNKEWSQIGEEQKKYILANPTAPENIPGTPEFNKQFGYGEPKAKLPSTYDYEQMGVSNRWEVFDTTTGKTYATVGSEKEAKDFIAGHDAKSDTQKALDEIENILNFWDREASEFGKKAAQYDPKANADSFYAQVKQEQDVAAAIKNKTGFEHNSPEYWDQIYKNLDNKKPSPKEAFLEGFQEAKQGFATAIAEIKNKFNTAIRGPLGLKVQPPSVTGRGEYTEPAYRGLTVYGGEVPNPVYKYSPDGEHYSTASPMLADMYAGYLNSHPGIKVPEGVFGEGAQVMPLLINTKNYHYYDAKGEIWQKANRKAIQEAKVAGKKGVIVDNVWDEPNSTTALGVPNKIYITFPEGAGTVKSRFAEKFDESSPNYLHTIGIVGPAGLIAYEATKDK